MSCVPFLFILLSSIPLTKCNSLRQSMSDSERDFSRLFHDSYSDNFDDDDASGSSKVALRNYVDVRVCSPYKSYKSYKSYKTIF